MTMSKRRGQDIEVFADAFAGYWIVTKLQFWCGDFNRSKDAAWEHAKRLADETNAVARLVSDRHGAVEQEYHAKGEQG